MIGRAFAIADRWSWAVLRELYHQGPEPGVWVARTIGQSPARVLSHEDREALEWLSHRALIEVAPDFASVRVLEGDTVGHE